MKGYTHLALIYGVECYFNIHTYEIKGTTWFANEFIKHCLWFDMTFCNNTDFNIQLIRKL